MNMLLYIILYLSLLFEACESYKLHTHQLQTNPDSLVPHSKSNFRQLAFKHLGKGVDFLINESQTMVLCKKVVYATRGPMANTIRFVVVSIAQNRIIYEDQIANGNVEWFNNTQLRIYTFSEIVQNTPKQRIYYLYDLETKHKFLPYSNKL